MSRVNRSFSMDGGLSRELDAEADKLGINRSALVESFVRNGLEKAYKEREERNRKNFNTAASSILAIAAFAVAFL